MDARETARVLNLAKISLETGGDGRERTDAEKLHIEALATTIGILDDVAAGTLMRRSEVFAAIRKNYLLSDYEREQVSNSLHKIPPYSGPTAP